MLPETLKKLCVTFRFRGKSFFAPKLGEMGQKWPKIGFFEFKEKCGHQFLLYSILKIFICCVPAKILWEKSCSSDIGQNPLSQSDCRISK